MTRSESPIRWGIVGTGGIAHQFARDLLTTGHTVTAVASRRAETAAAFAAEFGLAHHHAGYEGLVADEKVDVVYVATPHSRHAADALLALSAGKHVLVEKAFTQNARQARDVADTAAQSGLFAMEAMWTRFLPHMRELRARLADGAIGEVQTVIADHNQVLSTDPTSRLRDPRLAGGALLDLGIYPLSFAVDLLGIPTSVQASGTMTSTRVDRQTAVLTAHANGAQAFSQCALDQPGTNTATVIGSEGYIVIDRTWYAPTSFTQFNADAEPVYRYDDRPPARGMQFQADEVERCIALGATSSRLMPVEESVALMGLLDEVRAQLGFALPGDE